MSEKIIQLNEGVIKEELNELVRKSVEDTLNTLLDEEADRLTNARRWYRQESFAHLSYRVMFGDPPPGGRVPERGAILCPLFLHHFFFYRLQMLHVHV